MESLEFSIESVVRISDRLAKEKIITDTAAISAPMDEQAINGANRALRRILLENVQGIRSLLYNAISFDSFYVYLPKQNLLIDSRTTYYENINPLNLDFLQLDTEKHEWSPTRAVDYYTLNGIKRYFGESETLLTFVTDIYNDDDGVGIRMATNIKADFLSDFYNRVQKGIPGTFMVLGNDGNVLVNSDPELTLQNSGLNLSMHQKLKNEKKQSGNFEIDIGGERYFAIYAISSNTLWNYVLLVPSMEIYGQIYDMKKYFILVMSAIMLLMIPVCFFITGFLYKPLEKLVLAMQEMEKGNLAIKIDDRRRDEYQKVYNGFNEMTRKLTSLLTDLSNEKVANKQLEINLLQAQINPHFLYNTLDSIYSIAILHKVDTISRMVAALSKFFRVSLSGGKTDVLLSDCLDIVKSYLTIQNIRFDNKIKYTVSIADEYMQITVPKLLLQPIVENSVFHGIEQKKGYCHLDISCLPLPGRSDLQIFVKDDGIGIPENKLNLIRQSMSDDTADAVDADGGGENYALKNLNRQLMMKYGKKYGLSIESVFGKGTTVTIKVPMLYD
jgi:two-component system sensor histidine kinase YesM